MEGGIWVRKFRILTTALMFSGALNIGLLAALVFSVFEESRIPVAAAPAKASAGHPQPANQQLLLTMSKLSFPELIAYLTNKDPVEEGYAKRDLALSSLVAFHHFNLERALSFSLIQRRQISLTSGQVVELYPGLSEEQYEAIIRFAYQEKWPLTSKGLFQLLKKWPKNTRDASLAEAFFVTPEFRALQVLFQKTEAAQENPILLDLICEGPYDLLERFANEQAQALELSVEKRRSLLLSYLGYRSPIAAQLLLQIDFAFAKSRIEDAGIGSLLELLKEKTAESERFCIDLLRSPRSDAVLRAAAERLYAYAGEAIPVPLDFKAAVDRFAPVQTDSPKPPVPLKLAPLREYVVKEGDSLWKISRLYKVKVEDLIEANAIEKERLFPGMLLRIPQGTGSEPPR